MFCPLPVGNRAEEVSWLGRRAATEPGCWAKRGRTAARSGNNTGVYQKRARIVEVFNLACVEVDTGEAKVGPIDRTHCLRRCFLILQLGAVLSLASEGLGGIIPLSDAIDTILLGVFSFSDQEKERLSYVKHK